MQECLADIEVALSLGFPTVSQYKLYRRRGLCLAQLGDRAGARRGKLHMMVSSTSLLLVYCPGLKQDNEMPFCRLIILRVYMYLSSSIRGFRGVCQYRQSRRSRKGNNLVL